MTGSPQRNHEPSVLSTAPLTPSERANVLRYRADPAAGAHVESSFLKGNSGDGTRALWIKYTLLVPAHGAAALAELWAVAFQRTPGRAQAPRANKRSYPLAQASISEEPFALGLPDGELRHGSAQGALGFDGQGGPRLRWDLRYACPEREHRPFPSAWMYGGSFPRTKTLTPVPDTLLRGWFEVDGERWDVDGYRAAQGHNWGKGHAHAYAWAHGNAFERTAASAPCERVWLEAISGRVKLGPLSTPWLSAAAICIDDELYRFDGLSALLARSVRVDTRSYAFELRQGEARLSAELRADTEQLAGLHYRDPDGQTLSCLNSKLAYAKVALTARGRTWSFQSDKVALELGTRKPGHGVTILA